MELSRRALFELSVRAEEDGRVRALVNAFIVRFIELLAAEKRAGGSRFWKLAQRAAPAIGRYRARKLAQLLDLRPSDVGDLGRLQDWEDRGFGVTGVWRERGRTRAVKCEVSCPFAHAATAVPEFCTEIVHAFETATYRELNPSYRLVPLTRLLSKGDSLCEFVHEIDDHPERPT